MRTPPVFCRQRHSVAGRCCRPVNVAGSRQPAAGWPASARPPRPPRTGWPACAPGITGCRFSWIRSTPPPASARRMVPSAASRAAIGPGGSPAMMPSPSDATRVRYSAASSRRVRVIQPDRDRPVMARLFVVERAQVAGCVERVGPRVERLVHRGERVRVVLQVHLQAADVDEAHPAARRAGGPGDRLRGGVERQVLAVGVDGPGPGPPDRVTRHRPAALDLRQARHQPVRDARQRSRRVRGADALFRGWPRRLGHLPGKGRRGARQCENGAEGRAPDGRQRQGPRPKPAAA